ncbi:MAG: hypothetical protein H0V81_15220, partial [Solirubrobacterales bacterium]|nr:hypothetical protein [Solirubrobacterales bacterium]
DPAVCLQPYSNDLFTKADATSATGRRVHLATASMPTNLVGKPFDPAELNIADGFSPGSSLVTRVPGLDGPAAARASGLPPIDDPGASLLSASPVVVLNARTGERHPVWAEIDANAADPADRNLIIRPARNFEEGERYVVGLRPMKQADGTAIPATRAFEVYRDGIITTAKVVEDRRPAMESTLKVLTDAGVDRGGLFLAWDFTVATPATTTARMLSIRDRAFAELGDRDLADRTVTGSAPTFQLNPDLPDDLPAVPGLPVSFADLDGIQNFTADQDPQIARIIRGTFVTPCFLTTPGCLNGGTFASTGDPFTPARLPGNVSVAQFTCEIPRRALVPGAREKLRPNLYGHGLFGGQGEVQQGQQKAFAQEHGFLPCAADWDGMATKDVPTALAVLQDLSTFPLLIDHVQQGFLQQLFLGRLMLHPDGFAAQAAFQRPGGESVIDTSRLFYDGNSQGGIYGGTLTAIAPDFERATLGVPGMNYSTLLPRSVDFDTYANGSFGGFDAPVGGLYDNYPDELERPLILALLQGAWDRGDPNGYAQHMTGDPLPNTPTHEVLMHVGLGDHQVADVSAEVQARTIGARVHRPGLEPLRRRFTFDPAFGHPDPSGSPQPFSLLDSLGAPGYSASGSGIVFWDIGPPREGGQGTPAPPAANLPPRVGRDPHEAPRNAVAARAQKSAFLRDGGRIVDVCAGPCYAFDYTGGAAQP